MRGFSEFPHRLSDALLPCIRVEASSYSSEFENKTLITKLDSEIMLKDEAESAAAQLLEAVFSIIKQRCGQPA